MAKILIADDDESMQILMSQSLEMMGHEIVSVRDGQQALDLWHRHVPELLIADVNMPHLGGLQVVEHLRHANDWTPVIIVTADEPSGNFDDYTHFLAKPFSPPRLIAFVNQVLQSA